MSPSSGRLGLSVRGAMARRTAATLILAAWVGALGWLVERHYLGGSREEGPRWPVPPGSTFQAIRLGERQVGIRSFTVDTLPTGLRVVELVTLDMPPVTPGVLRRTSIRTEGLYSRGLQLQRFRLNILAESGREERSGEVLGDSLLVLINAPDRSAPETLQVHLRRPVLLPGAIPLVVASRGLPKPGDRLNADVYDPVNMVLQLQRFTVVAESLFVVPDSAEYNENLKRWAVAHADTVRTWRLDGTPDGLPVSRWIDAAGMVVRARYALGSVMDRSAFEMVQTNFRALPPPKWDTTASAPQYLPDSSSPPARRALTVMARLVVPDQSLPPGIESLEGGWQTRTGDTIRVARPGPEAPGDSAPDRKEQPIWSLFQGDSTLRDVAALASGRESRPEAVAGALEVWVHKTIRFRKGPGMVSPARVLAARQGNEVERVLLLTALVQSTGLQARPVWGLVLVRGRWQLRSWVEVWADRWLPFDPAIGARGVDAGRVRLATSGVGRLMDLALRAGRLRLDVLEETR